jgi:hypothetical protein
MFDYSMKAIAVHTMSLQIKAHVARPRALLLSRRAGALDRSCSLRRISAPA